MVKKTIVGKYENLELEQALETGVDIPSKFG